MGAAITGETWPIHRPCAASAAPDVASSPRPSRARIRKTKAPFRIAQRRARTKDRPAVRDLGAEEGRVRAQDRRAARVAEKKIRAAARATQEEIRDPYPSLRAEERHPPRRRSALHPDLDREAAGDRGGDPIQSRARPRHGR